MGRCRATRWSGPSTSTSDVSETSSARRWTARATSSPCVEPGTAYWTRRPPPCPPPEGEGNEHAVAAAWDRPADCTALLAGHGRGGDRHRRRRPGRRTGDVQSADARGGAVGRPGACDVRPQYAPRLYRGGGN